MKAMTSIAHSQKKINVFGLKRPIDIPNSLDN